MPTDPVGPEDRGALARARREASAQRVAELRELGHRLNTRRASTSAEAAHALESLTVAQQRAESAQASSRKAHLLAADAHERAARVHEEAATNAAPRAALRHLTRARELREEAAAELVGIEREAEA
jgi:hypothetical protein